MEIMLLPASFVDIVVVVVVGVIVVSCSKSTSRHILLVR